MLEGEDAIPEADVYLLASQSLYDLHSAEPMEKARRGKIPGSLQRITTTLVLRERLTAALLQRHAKNDAYPQHRLLFCDPAKVEEFFGFTPTRSDLVDARPVARELFKAMRPLPLSDVTPQISTARLPEALIPQTMDAQYRRPIAYQLHLLSLSQLQAFAFLDAFCLADIERDGQSRREEYSSDDDEYDLD